MTLVILGNQFICDKKILNIVQRTSVMPIKEIESYVHTHQFLKDQRAIAIDANVDVKPGYIFTGAEFVDPINLRRIPIEGAIEEEETNPVKEDDFERFYNMIMGFDAKLDKLITKIDGPSEYIEDIDAVRPFYRAKIFSIDKDVLVYKKTGKELERVGMIKGGSTIIGYGMCRDFKYINIDDDLWFEFDVSKVTVGEDIHSVKEEAGEKIAISYFEKRRFVIADVQFDNMSLDEYLKKEKLQKLVNTNMTRKDIANEFGVTASTIGKWIRKYNIKREEV